MHVVASCKHCPRKRKEKKRKRKELEKRGLGRKLKKADM
jgi:hypothetical protein